MLLWWIAATGRAGEAQDALAACEAGLATEPNDRLAWRCFYTAARMHDAWDAARARMEREVRLHPPARAARLALGALLGDLGDPSAERAFRLALEAFAVEGGAQEGWARRS